MSGQTPEWHRKHPIFGTDFSRPVPEIIEEIRKKLAQLRGQLSDIGFGFPGYAERTRTAEEGLTLIIAYLHQVLEEIKAARPASTPLEDLGPGETAAEFVERKSGDCTLCGHVSGRHLQSCPNAPWR